MNQYHRTNNSLFANLRGLVPQRPLRFSEALRIVELQAQRLRQSLGITSPELPDLTALDLPRIELIELDDLPSSGVNQWHNGRWLIVINAQEPWQRQRFSAAHELWHCLNHTTEQWLCTPEGWRGSAEKRERLAEYFAGCLLVPKSHLKRLVGEGLTTSDLADVFGVSTRAIDVRLSQVGLSEPRPRCLPMGHHRPIGRHTYICNPDESQGMVA